jgi:hypothetical protein
MMGEIMSAQGRTGEAIDTLRAAVQRGHASAPSVSFSSRTSAGTSP